MKWVNKCVKSSGLSVVVECVGIPVILIACKWLSASARVLISSFLTYSDSALEPGIGVH